MKLSVFSLMQWPEDRSQEDVFRNETEQLVVAELGEHGIAVVCGPLEGRRG